MRLADRCFYLEEMPINVFYTKENAVIDMPTKTMVILNTENFVISEKLKFCSENHIVCAINVYNFTNNNIVESSQNVLGAT